MNRNLLSFTTIAMFAIFSALQASATTYPVTDPTQLNLKTWTATYAGETNVDNLKVSVVLELADHNKEIIPSLADKLITILPLSNVKTKDYRLTIFAADNPYLRASYALKKQMTPEVSITGKPMLYSQNINDSEYMFVLNPIDTDSYEVRYTRQLSETDFITDHFVIKALTKPIQLPNKPTLLLGN